MASRTARPEPIVGNFSQETLAEMIGTIAGELFHEQIPQIGLYRSQRKIGSSAVNARRSAILTT
jgi:hypothetical protein